MIAFAKRGQGKIARYVSDPVSLRVRRRFTQAFLKYDIDKLQGVRYQPEGLTEHDHELPRTFIGLPRCRTASTRTIADERLSDSLATELADCRHSNVSCRCDFLVGVGCIVVVAGCAFVGRIRGRWQLDLFVAPRSGAWNSAAITHVEQYPWSIIRDFLSCTVSLVAAKPLGPSLIATGRMTKRSISISTTTIPFGNGCSYMAS